MSGVAAMIRTCVLKVLSVSLVAVVAGCAAPQSLEMSRSAVAIQVPQPAAISALSKQFRAETPYIVNFDFDKDVLDAVARAKLDIQADWILAHPDVKFRVYGHTDKVGNVVYNEDLGMRRATNVVAYLISRGISEHRLEAVASFGEDLPLIDTESPERLNRRALTDVIGFVVPSKDEPQRGGPDLVSRLFEDDIPPVTDEDDGQVPDVSNDEPPADDTPTDTVSDGKNPNSGRGNGDEDGDPGKSGGKNNGGDEVS